MSNEEREKLQRQALEAQSRYIAAERSLMTANFLAQEQVSVILDLKDMLVLCQKYILRHASTDAATDLIISQIERRTGRYFLETESGDIREITLEMHNENQRTDS